MRIRCPLSGKHPWKRVRTSVCKGVGKIPDFLKNKVKEGKKCRYWKARCTNPDKPYMKKGKKK
jgi:hypothetical protein